jgi:hypothetical protein
MRIIKSIYFEVALARESATIKGRGSRAGRLEKPHSVRNILHYVLKLLAWRSCQWAN